MFTGTVIVTPFTDYLSFHSGTEHNLFLIRSWWATQSRLKLLPRRSITSLAKGLEPIPSVFFTVHRYWATLLCVPYFRCPRTVSDSESLFLSMSSSWPAFSALLYQEMDSRDTLPRDKPQRNVALSPENEHKRENVKHTIRLDKFLLRVVFVLKLCRHRNQKWKKNTYLTNLKRNIYLAKSKKTNH